MKSFLIISIIERMEIKPVFYTFLNFFRKLLIRKIEKNGQFFLSYKGELYPEYLFQKNATAYIKEKALKYCRGRGLDIGAGAFGFAGAIGVENRPEENAYKLDKYENASLDFVFSSHCLEHLGRWEEALRLWIRKLKPGGILFLYLPHISMVMWRPDEVVGIQHAWSPTWEILLPFLEKEGMEIIECEKGRDRYWSFHIAARKK